jgi:hypothetical protein
MRIFYFSVLLLSSILSAFSQERGKKWYGTIPSEPGDEQFQRIYVQDATLFHEDGSEVALWGLNFQSAMSWEWGRSRRDGRPRSFDSSDWKSIVDRGFDEIQQMGCEVIRIHLCPGDFADSEGNLVENEWLDMVDYTIAECHRRGIYISFSLINHLQVQGGVVDGAFIDYNDKDLRWELMVDPEKIAISENYIRQLVNRRNPYDNNRKYKHNPAWIIAEIMNEPTWPKNVPQSGEFPVGRAAYDQWLLENSKADSNTSWDEFQYQKTKTYVNQMNALLYEEKVPAVPSWNLFWARGPIHQGWVSYDAAADSDIPMVSFGTYIGKELGKQVEKRMPGQPVDLSTTNMLPEIQDSYDKEDWQGWARQDRFKNKKARVVYEFNTNYNLSSYVHPAMAKYFRAQGAQVATMWTYYLREAGSENNENEKANLNLVTTPRKAAGFMVAGEIFEETPRYIAYKTSEEDADQFGNAALSFPMDLSAYATDDLLIHSGDLDGDFITLPRTPKQIAGYGSSPFIQYQGKGMYFLEAVFEDGRFANRWSLKIMPNVTFGEDDYPIIDVDKEFPFTLRFPAIDFRNWEVYNIKNGEKVRAVATPQSISFDAAPGEYEIVYGDL